MTTKRDLKALIRERQKETGEKYVGARRQVLRSSGNRCPACNEPLADRVLIYYFRECSCGTKILAG